MKVFETEPLAVDVADTVDSAGLQALRLMDGRSLAGSWEPPRVRLVTTDEYDRPLPSSDMPSTALAPVFRRAAFESISPLPGDYEVLPLQCDDADLIVLNVTRVLTGAVDLDQSKVTRIPSKIVMIQHPAFREEVVADVPIFKLAEVPRGRVYFNQIWADALSSLTNVAVRTEWGSRA